MRHELHTDIVCWVKEDLDEVQKKNYIAEYEKIEQGVTDCEALLKENPIRLHYRVYEELGTEYGHMVKKNLLGPIAYTGFRINPGSININNLKKFAQTVLEDLEGLIPEDGGCVRRPDLPFFFDEKNYFHWLGKKKKLRPKTAEYIQKLMMAEDYRVEMCSADQEQTWRTVFRKNAKAEVIEKFDTQGKDFDAIFKSSKVAHWLKKV